jgi:hypothetical protein
MATVADIGSVANTSAAAATSAETPAPPVESAAPPPLPPKPAGLIPDELRTSLQFPKSTSTPAPPISALSVSARDAETERDTALIDTPSGLSTSGLTSGVKPLSGVSNEAHGAFWTISNLRIAMAVTVVALIIIALAAYVWGANWITSLLGAAALTTLGVFAYMYWVRMPGYRGAGEECDAESVEGDLKKNQ